MLVTGDTVEWFVKKGGQPDSDTLDSFQELRDEGVAILPYDDVPVVLAGEIEDGTIGHLAVDPSTLNYNLYHILKTNSVEGTVVEWDSPVALRKSVKNATEIEGMRDIHVEDGLAMERFLYWLEKSVKGGGKVDEWDAARKLGALRAEIPGYRGDSFETISAYGEGAALPHYITPHMGALVLEPRAARTAEEIVRARDYLLGLWKDA